MIGSNTTGKIDIFNLPKGVGISITKITPEYDRDKWNTVSQLIQDYTKTHPDQMREFVRTMRVVRATRLNKFGSSKSKSVRWGLSIPVGLDLLIRKYFPDLLTTKKNLHTFMKKFPGFRVSELT